MIAISCRSQFASPFSAMGRVVVEDDLPNSIFKVGTTSIAAVYEHQL